MRVAGRGVGAVAALGLLIGTLSACTSSGPSQPQPQQTVTSTIVNTRPPTTPIPTNPVSTGPTKAATASTCPYLEKQSAADKVGMRLGRITVLTSGGKTVGCRFYAVQDSVFNASEHLPGPNQPAIEIETLRYPSDDAAHNAFIIASQRGDNVQQASILGQSPGLCFQIDFYKKDNGTDWACSFAKGRTVAIVRTVVTSPALNAILVARAVGSKL